MRLQLALNVDDLDEAIAFYRKAFGVDVHKRRPGYANFEVESPPLKLVLFENPGAPRLNHLGVEVFDDASVAAAGERLREAGLASVAEDHEVCCFAEQNKVFTHDPQGMRWEWYRITDDAPEARGGPRECCADAAHVETGTVGVDSDAGPCCSTR